MNTKQKLNCAKAGATAYIVSSAVDYLIHGGIQFINQSGAWVLKANKSLGLVDVFRLHGHLANIDVFGPDGWLFIIGMGSGAAAAIVMWAYEKINSRSQVEKTTKGFSVKIKRPNLSNE